MIDTDFDFSGDEWFDEEVIRWNTERKRQYLYVLPRTSIWIKKEKYFEGGRNPSKIKQKKLIYIEILGKRCIWTLLDPLMAYQHNPRGFQLDSKNVDSYSKFKLSQKFCMKNIKTRIFLPVGGENRNVSKSKKSRWRKWYDFSRWRKWDLPKLGPLFNLQDQKNFPTRSEKFS